jgi:hypothetical protein
MYINHIRYKYENYTYLPHTDDGISNENKQYNKGFNKGGDLVIMFFKQG